MTTWWFSSTSPSWPPAAAVFPPTPRGWRGSFPPEDFSNEKYFTRRHEFVEIHVVQLSGGVIMVFGLSQEDKPTIYSLYLIKWWGVWYCRRCHVPTLWAFFSIASCRSLLSRSSLSLLSLRLSLTRRDLHQKVIYEKKMDLKLNMRRPASTLPARSFLFPASFLFHLHM